MKTNPQLQEAAQAGADWCKTPGAPDLKGALPYIPSSPMANAFLIGAWCQYWTGKAPRAIDIASSLGDRMKLEDKDFREHVVIINDAYDHRDGIADIHGRRIYGQAVTA